MMMQAAERGSHAGNGCGDAGRSRKADAIRAKFRDVFGRECPLTDDTLLRRYTVTADGDLILFLR